MMFTAHPSTTPALSEVLRCQALQLALQGPERQAADVVARADTFEHYIRRGRISPAQADGVDGAMNAGSNSPPGFVSATDPAEPKRQEFVCVQQTHDLPARAHYSYSVETAIANRAELEKHFGGEWRIYVSV